jgi:lyso-ornithine lipid O-acyltransferase
MGGLFRIAWVVAAVLALTVLLLPLHGAALAFRHHLRLLVPVWWHRIVCRLMRLRVVQFGDRAAARPLLLVSNHVSWKDIAALGSLAPLCFIAKGEVRAWPVFGWLARLQRTVFIDRDNRQDTSRQAATIAQRLAHERDVMVLFAEGTTGDGTRLLPFKSSLVGAAEKAIAAKPAATDQPKTDRRMMIQPVAILYGRSGGMPAGFVRRLAAAWIGDVALLPHLREILLAPPIDAEIMFGAPIVVDHTFDRKAVTRQLESTIGQMLRNRRRGLSFDAAPEEGHPDRPHAGTQ